MAALADCRHDPPEVTWPDPELADGAVPDFRPEDELPEDELPEDELPDDELPDDELPDDELADDDDELLPDWRDTAACAAPVSREAAAAAPGRPMAMAPPATTLAAPIAAVTARSRRWPRLRAATAAATPGS